MENKLLADAMKAEGEVMLLTAEAEKEAHLEACKTLVEEVKAVRQTAPREAQARVFEEKVRRREQLTKEKAEAWAKFEEEKRIEQERKDDLIRQIRALERVPKQRVKMFDPTESSGVGLLEEMSLVELKERLELNKARYEEEEEERRRLILRRKREKEVDLRARVKNISRIRSTFSPSHSRLLSAWLCLHAAPLTRPPPPLPCRCRICSQPRSTRPPQEGGGGQVGGGASRAGAGQPGGGQQDHRQEARATQGGGAARSGGGAHREAAHVPRGGKGGHRRAPLRAADAGGGAPSHEAASRCAAGRQDCGGDQAHREKRAAHSPACGSEAKEGVGGGGGAIAGCCTAANVCGLRRDHE